MLSFTKDKLDKKNYKKEKKSQLQKLEFNKETKFQLYKRNKDTNKKSKKKWMTKEKSLCLMPNGNQMKKDTDKLKLINIIKILL